MNCGFVPEDEGWRARPRWSLLLVCRALGRSRCLGSAQVSRRRSGFRVLGLPGLRRWLRPRFRLRTGSARKWAERWALAGRILRRPPDRGTPALARLRRRPGRRAVPTLLNLILLNPESGRNRRWRGRES